MDLLYQFIDQYCIIAILIIIFLEYACFPISSELVLPLAGMLAKGKYMPFYEIWLLSIIAGVLGSLLCYFLGLFGGKNILSRVLKKIPKAERSFNKSSIQFQKTGFISTLLSRLVPLCRTYISIIAGFYKQSILKFLLSTIIGVAIWNFILIFLGYYAFKNIASFSEILKIYEVYLISFILLILFFMQIKTYLKSSNN